MTQYSCDRMVQAFAAQGPAALADLPTAELLKLVEPDSPPKTPELLEAIAMQAGADATVLEAIVAQGADDPALLTAIANLVKAPMALLQKLARHPSRGVSEKARINLTRIALRSASVEEVMSALDAHSSDSYVDVGIRYNLACDPTTGEPVLQRLAGDDMDAIADIARDRLRGQPNR